nr:MAG TPA: PcfJ like protein [Caudoviricetes sp.]
MFDSVILESHYDAAYTTVHHTDCGFTFGGKWKRNYNYSNGYTTAAKYFTCPNCGVHSEPHRDRIFQTIFESSLVPLSVWAEVVELKDAIDLRISYKAITLNMDGTSIDEGIRKEVLRFDFKKKKAVYTDYNRQKYDLTPDYIREHYFMQVLEYFGKSYAMHSINKKPLNDLFRVLRVAFQKRLLATYGYSSADVYISPSANEEGGYYFNMLLNMALKIAAPDMPNIAYIHRCTSYWNDSHMYCRNINIPIGNDVFELTRKGVNFHEAMRIVHKSPNSRSLRKAMTTNPMAVYMSEVLKLFNDENIRRTIMTLNRVDVPITEVQRYSGKVQRAKDIRKSMKLHIDGSKEFWQLMIARYGEPSALRWILSEDFRDIEDCVRMYAELQLKYRDMFWGKRFKLKDLHAEIINIYNKQEYGDVNLPKVPELNADVNGMHFMVPKTAADLMMIGKELKNCVGSYKDKVMRGSIAIVVVTDDNMKPIACLELSKGDKKFTKLVQAKLFGNQCVHKNKDINNTVLKWANQLEIEPRTIDVQAQVS